MLECCIQSSSDFCFTGFVRMDNDNQMSEVVMEWLSTRTMFCPFFLHFSSMNQSSGTHFSSSLICSALSGREDREWSEERLDSFWRRECRPCENVVRLWWCQVWHQKQWELRVPCWFWWVRNYHNHRLYRTMKWPNTSRQGWHWSKSNFHLKTMKHTLKYI